MHGGLSFPESTLRAYIILVVGGLSPHIHIPLATISTMTVLTSPGGVLATRDSGSVDASVSSSPAQLTTRRSDVSSQRAMTGVFRRTRSILNNFVKVRPVSLFIGLCYDYGPHRCASARQKFDIPPSEHLAPATKGMLSISLRVMHARMMAAYTYSHSLYVK